MMKIFCRLLVGVLCLGIVLTGSSSCRGGHQTSPGRMAVVITTLNNPWFVVCAETAVAKANALGYEAVVFDSQFDPSKEAEHFDNIIAAGYDAILFSPTDADGSIANTVRAMQAGIPVFCMCCEINDPSACVT